MAACALYWLKCADGCDDCRPPCTPPPSDPPPPGEETIPLSPPAPQGSAAARLPTGREDCFKGTTFCVLSGLRAGLGQTVQPSRQRTSKPFTVLFTTFVYSELDSAWQGRSSNSWCSFVQRLDGRIPNFEV